MSVILFSIIYAYGDESFRRRDASDHGAGEGDGEIRIGNATHAPVVSLTSRRRYRARADMLKSGKIVGLQTDKPLKRAASVWRR